MLFGVLLGLLVFCFVCWYFVYLVCCLFTLTLSLFVKFALGFTLSACVDLLLIVVCLVVMLDCLLAVWVWVLLYCLTIGFVFWYLFCVLLLVWLLTSVCLVFGLFGFVLPGLLVVGGFVSLICVCCMCFAVGRGV